MVRGNYVTYLIISERFGEILFNFILENDFREKGHLPLVFKICWQETEISKVFCDSYIL